MSTRQTATGGPTAQPPLRIRVFGVHWDLGFHGLAPDVVAMLRELWARAAVPVDPTDPEVDAVPLPVASAAADVAEADRTDRHPTVVGEDVASIPYTLSRSVTLRSITRRSGEALMLHAVGVCGPDGRTVALVAPSGTGKTTAASVLGRCLGYVTDETVVLEADDTVSPYPKPLSIVTDATRAHEKHERSPDSLGLLPCPTDSIVPTIAAVVVIRRDPDLAAPRLELLPLLEAILDVIPETSALPSLPGPLDWLCRVLTKSGGPYRLTYAEIDQCVDLVRSLTVADTERDADILTWTHIPGTGWAEPVDDAQTPETPRVAWDDVVERCSWTDGVLADGELLLLHGLVPIRLSHLGTVLWLHSGQPARIADLHDEVVAEIGPNVRSAALVLEAVQSLVDAGVLRCVTGPDSPS